MSNTNLLRNWYFANPVNQFGRTEYTTTGYTIDSWTRASYLEHGKLSIVDGGIKIAQSNGYTDFRQILENTITGTVTFSALASDGILHTETGELGNLNRNAVPTNGLALYSTGANNVTIRLRPEARDTIVAAAKLEPGPFQTLAHKENGVWVLNEVPDYARELAKCQRYQFVIPDIATNFGGILGYGYCANTTDARICFPTPVSMRGKPTIAWLQGAVTDLIIIDHTGTHPVTGVVNFENYGNVVWCIFKSTGLASPCPCVLKLNSAAQFMLDANL